MMVNCWRCGVPLRFELHLRSPSRKLLPLNSGDGSLHQCHDPVYKGRGVQSNKDSYHFCWITKLHNQRTSDPKPLLYKRLG